MRIAARKYRSVTIKFEEKYHAYIQTISPAKAHDNVLAMYERQQAAYGYLPNYAKVFSHRPEVLERWGKLLAAIRRPIYARRFELITFAAAQALRNAYCSLAHGKALTSFFKADEVRTIASNTQSEVLTDAERAMMQFARQVATDASKITSKDTSTLKSHGFSDEEIFDIAATAAARSFFTKLLDALGAAADASLLEMDETLRQSLTIRHPISNQSTE